MEFTWNKTGIVWTGFLLTLLVMSVIARSADASGTRMIPPPPPRSQDDESIQQVSYWGKSPPSLNAMNDDEGREVSVAPETAPLNHSDSGRAPASVEDGSVEQKPTLSRQSSSVRADLSKASLVGSDDPVTRRKGVQEIAVIAGDLGFFPKTIFVSRDVPVRLFVTGASKGSNCLMMDSFNVRKQIHTNKIEEITFTPTQPGTFRFYCPVNGSEGALVVKELTTSEGSVIQ